MRDRDVTVARAILVGRILATAAPFLSLLGGGAAAGVVLFEFVLSAEWSPMAKWQAVLLICVSLATLFIGLLGGLIGGSILAGRWWRSWAAERCVDLRALDLAASEAGLTRAGAFDPCRKDEEGSGRSRFQRLFEGGFDGDGGGGDGGGDGGGGDG